MASALTYTQAMETVKEFDAKIAAAQAEILEAKQRIVALRKERPREEVKNYSFTNWNGEEATLESLFADRNELIIVHNMGIGCNYCTLWADGFNGERMHLSSRAAFCVISNDPIEVQQKFAGSRDWKFPMVSSKENTFFVDMGFANEAGDPWPGISCFRKEEDGSIVRTGREDLGEGDDFCAVWFVFSLLGDDLDSWSPTVVQPEY